MRSSKWEGPAVWPLHFRSNERVLVSILLFGFKRENPPISISSGNGMIKTGVPSHLELPVWSQTGGSSCVGSKIFLRIFFKIWKIFTPPNWEFRKLTLNIMDQYFKYFCMRQRVWKLWIDVGTYCTVQYSLCLI